MKNLINKTSSIAIIIAMLLMVSWKPAKAQWNHVELPKQDNTLTWVCVGISAAALVATVVILVVKKNKHNNQAAIMNFKNNNLPLNGLYPYNRKIQEVESCNYTFGLKTKVHPAKFEITPIKIKKNVLLGKPRAISNI